MFFSADAKRKLAGGMPNKLKALKKLLQKPVYGKKQKVDKAKNTTLTNKDKKAKNTNKKPEKATDFESAKEQIR